MSPSALDTPSTPAPAEMSQAQALGRGKNGQPIRIRRDLISGGYVVVVGERLPVRADHKRRPGQAGQGTAQQEPEPAGCDAELEEATPRVR